MSIFLKRAKVTVYDGCADEPFPKCALTVIGQSPNATARLSVFDEASGRLVEYDRLLRATVEQTKNGYEIRGTSETLRDEVGAPDASAVWEVDASRACGAC